MRPEWGPFGRKQQFSTLEGENKAMNGELRQWPPIRAARQTPEKAETWLDARDGKREAGQLQTGTMEMAQLLTLLFPPFSLIGAALLCSSLLRYLLLNVST